MRYFLLDRITSVVAGKSAEGIKCVSLSDETLHDHFPGFPVLPGALLTEGLAQLAGYLVEASAPEDEGPRKRALLTCIEKMKFYRLCTPGDQVRLTAEIASSIGDNVKVAVEARVGAERAAAGALLFALRAVDAPRVHEQRRELYDIWTKDLAR